MFSLMQFLECLLKYLLVSFNNSRSSHPEVFLEKGVLKTCSKFTGKQPCGSMISIKLLCNFIEITLRHGCSPVNLLHIFRTPFPKNTSGRLFLWINFTSPKLKVILQNNFQVSVDKIFQSKCTYLTRF